MELKKPAKHKVLRNEIFKIRFTLREGSGGDYLSNEIFYRVSYLRNQINSSLITGHVHMGFLSTDEYMENGTKEGRTKMLEIIKKSLTQALETL